ncbi:TPA: hypothetical protein MX214_004406 [Citrobacter sedlakii]|nr:hypothetical protein [Citrobacter sedlakii]HCA7137635.1 hypothetical protein [Citrobacter sedlakii]HCA7183769.1 hypothetical protein [Citrobacter sedlakii]
MESKKYILIAVAFFFAVLTAFTWRVIALSVIQDDAEVRNEAQQNILYLQGLYNKNDFSTIYANGTDDFKNITNKEDIFNVDEKKKRSFR